MKKDFKKKLKDKQRELAKANQEAKERYKRKKLREAECKKRELENDRPAPQPGPRLKETPRSKNDLRVMVAYAEGLMKADMEQRKAAAKVTLEGTKVSDE